MLAMSTSKRQETALRCRVNLVLSLDLGGIKSGMSAAFATWKSQPQMADSSSANQCLLHLQAPLPLSLESQELEVVERWFKHL